MYRSEIAFSPDKLTETLLESNRNFYVSPSNKGWSALKAGKSVQLIGQHTDTGWTMVFIVVDGKEYQLTKKQIRTNDLKFYFQRGV